jgi:hypothetical protein
MVLIDRIATKGDFVVVDRMLWVAKEVDDNGIYIGESNTFVPHGDYDVEVMD